MDVPLELLLLFCVGALVVLVGLFFTRKTTHRIRAATIKRRRSNWLQLIVWALVCVIGFNVANIAIYLHFQPPEANAMAAGIYFPVILLLLATINNSDFD